VVGVDTFERGQRKRSCIEVRDRAQVYVPDDSETTWPTRPDRPANLPCVLCWTSQGS